MAEKNSSGAGRHNDEASGADDDNPAVDRLKSDLSSLRGDLEAAANTVNQLGSKAAHEALHQAQAQMDELRERIDEFLNEARTYGAQSAEVVKQHVQERPFASLLLALGAGFVLAHLVGRRQ